MDDLVAFAAALPQDRVPASFPLEFRGVRRDFRRIVMRGTLLELCTAGFYRFWLATAMRRHLWSNTSVDGDALEYTGRARELLIGFLFALAILMPIYFANFLIGIELERYKQFGSTPLFLAFYVFYQFAGYRARRYRATRTVWRGARFWMGGSGWSYAWRASLWTLLTALTLGLALPWREAALERYKMRHTYYGDVAGAFAATGWQLFKRGWWLWLLLLVVATAPFVYAGYEFGRMHPTASSAGAAGAAIGVMLARSGVWIAMLLAIPLTACVVYPAYKARLWRWWVEGIRFGEVRFESSFGFKSMFGLYAKTFGWALFIAAIDGAVIALAVAIWVKISGKGAAMMVQFSQSYPLLSLAATMANYILLVLAIGIVMRIYLLRDLWARIVTTTTVHNLDAVENVTVHGTAADAIGEGFGDSFDVVGF